MTDEQLKQFLLVLQSRIYDLEFDYLGFEPGEQERCAIATRIEAHKDLLHIFEAAGITS